MYMMYVEGVAAAVPVGLGLGDVCEEDSGRLLHVVVGLRNGSGIPMPRDFLMSESSKNISMDEDGILRVSINR